MADVKPHPSPQALAAFGLGKLPEAGAAAVAQHLEVCAACRQVLHNLPPDSFMGKLRHAATARVSALARVPRQTPASSPQPATTGVAPPADLPPELVNHPKYRIVGELGRGGMGIVYEAVQTLMDRPIALKVLNPAVLAHAEALPRFRTEVKAAAKLDHPNIVRAHDADQVGDLYLLVMELVEGMNLAQLVQSQGPLPVATACHYLHQAALGLQHAYELGMVHRDLKPQNLMVTPRGQLKILDFGLARVRSAGPKHKPLTQLDSFMGTPEYIAPEQAVDAHSADTRSDLYSLGATLYFLLTGRPPFPGTTAANQVMAQIEQEPPLLHQLRSDVPPELSGVAARLLAKDRSRRYQTPVELARALASFVQAGGKTVLVASAAVPPGVAASGTGTVGTSDTSRAKALGQVASQLSARSVHTSMHVQWPLPQDYNEAVQNPKTCFSDSELRQSEARCNALGLPMPHSGNFADVYEMIGPGGKRWAVKCFTRQVPGLRERYAAISAYLMQVNLPFMVDFVYQEQGIRVKGQWYPILKMEWVEGLALNQFIAQNADNPALLQSAAQLWLKLARRLREAKLAHGDLQHGNVLLVPGKRAGALSVRLIDYDGMCVPALVNQPPAEVGHPAYQHPQRLRQGDYNLEIDRFPHLVIYAALRALMECGRPLWKRYDNGDNLLFRQQDLAAPAQSPLVKELLQKNDNELRQLLDHLSRAVHKPVEQTPLLDDLVTTAVTSVPPKMPKKPSRARSATGPGWKRPLWLAGAMATVLGLVVGAVLLAGVVFKTKVRTVAGEAFMVLEVDQPGAEVFVDGERISVTVPGDNQPIEIKVEPGQHKLRIRKDGFEAVTRDIELTTGRSMPIRVRLEPVQIAAANSKDQPKASTAPSPAPPQSTNAPTPPSPKPAEPPKEPTPPRPTPAEPPQGTTPPAPKPVEPPNKAPVPTPVEPPKGPTPPAPKPVEPPKDPPTPTPKPVEPPKDPTPQPKDQPKNTDPQQKRAKTQPDEIAFGTVHTGAIAEANFAVMTPGRDTTVRFDVKAPSFVRILYKNLTALQTTDSVLGKFAIAINTSTPGRFKGYVSVTLGQTTVKRLVTATVKARRQGLIRLLVVKTPISGGSDARIDATRADPWRDLVDNAPLDANYLAITFEKPALRNLDLRGFDCVLLDGDGVCRLTAEEVNRVRAFAEAGGRVIVAANYFFRGSVLQANALLDGSRLQMHDIEARGDAARVTLAKDALSAELVDAGISRLYFFRASPVSVTDQKLGRVLVKAVGVGQPGDGFVAVANYGKGEFVALGHSLLLSWIKEADTDNAKLLRWLLVRQ